MPLTNKQMDVIDRLKDQLPVKKIAERCGVSSGEVRRYLESRNPGGNAEPLSAAPVPNWLFWPAILLAALTTHVFHPMMSDYSLPQSMVFHCGVLGLWLSVLGATLLNWRSLQLRAPHILLPLGLLLLWAALSLLWATNPYIGQFELYNWIGAGFFFWLILQFRPTTRQVATAMEVFFYSSALTALLGLAQFWGLTNYSDFFKQIQQTVPPAATLMHRNEAAHYVAMLMPFGACAGYYALRENRYVRLGLCAVGLALGAWFVDKTECAAAVGAGLGGGGAALFLLAALAWLRNRGHTARRLWLTGGGVAVAGLLLLALLALPSWQKTRQTVQNAGFEETTSYFFNDINLRLAAVSPFFEGHTLAHRLSIYANSAAMGLDYPLFGVGLGNAFIEYPRYHNRILEDRFFSQTLQMDHVHNDYLQIFVELGLIGGGLMLAVLALGILEFWRLLRAPESERPLVPVLALLWCVMGYAMIAFFNFPVERTPPVIVVALAAGLLFALGRTVQTPQPDRTRTWRLPAPAVPAALFLILTLLVLRAYRAGAEYREDMLFRDTQILQNTGNWDMISRLGSKILEHGSHNRWAMNNYMQALIRCSTPDFAKASQVGQQILALYPWATYLHGNYGAALLNQNRCQEALRSFAQMLQLVPEDQFAQEYFQNATKQGGLWQEALALLPPAAAIVEEHHQAYRLGRQISDPAFLAQNKPLMVERLREKMMKLRKVNEFRIQMVFQANEQLGRSKEAQDFLAAIKAAEHLPEPNSPTGR